MTYKTKTINHDDYGTVRFVTREDNSILLSAKDIARALRISKPYKLLADLLYDRYNIKIKTKGGTQSAVFVNGSGLIYMVEKSSIKDKAAFNDWIVRAIGVSRNEDASNKCNCDDDCEPCSTNSCDKNIKYLENKIQIFKSPAFGEIRTMVDENNEPLFVGKEIADILGYTNPHKALRDHIEEEDKRTERIVHPAGGMQQTILINESGLYCLILSSKLPQAKKFKKWVTSEVLPSIRKHGAYMTDNTINRALEDPDFLIQLATNLKQEKAKRVKAEEEAAKKQILIDEMKKKVDYLDVIMNSPSLVLVTQIAQDYGMSALHLNQLLNDMKIQYKVGDQWILYAEYKDKGYVSSDTIEVKKNSGGILLKTITKWTQKGRRFIYEMLKRRSILPVIEQQNKQTEIFTDEQCSLL